MAVAPSMRQFQTRFHSVETLLGIKKESLYKQNIIATHFKEKLLETEKLNVFKQSESDSANEAMKSGKCTGNVYMYCTCHYINEGLDRVY